MPRNEAPSVFPAFFKSAFFTAELMESAMLVPSFSHLKVVTNVYNVSTAVLNPSVSVFPTKFQLRLSIAPLRNVAIDFAIFFDVFLILFQGIFGSASFIFFAKVLPMSLKLPFFHPSISAFFILFASCTALFWLLLNASSHIFS